MQPIDIFSLLNVYYIAAVVLLMEFLKKYIPAVGAVRKNLMVLVVSFWLGIVFVAVEHQFGAGELSVFVQQLALSFLAATTFYSLIVKTVLSFLKKNE